MVEKYIYRRWYNTAQNILKIANNKIFKEMKEDESSMLGNKRSKRNFFNLAKTSLISCKQENNSHVRS